MKSKYVLSVFDKNTKEFKHIIDTFHKPKEAENAKSWLELDETEYAKITYVMYDDNGNKLQEIEV